MGSQFGLNGGINGTGFAAPGGPSSLFGTTNEQQIMNSYAGVQQNLGGQAGLLQALQQQNGLGNQSQVYGQLQGVANGTGPNPAQAQYQANIQNIAAQQAGAISSQKGISPALANREIAQQGGAAMQNAAAQGQANTAAQQLGAMQQSGQMANTMAANQIGQQNANTGSQLAEQGNVLNAAGAANQGAIAMQGNINNINGMLAGQTMGQQNSLMTGALTGGGSLVMGAKGGMVQRYDDGGDVESANFSNDSDAATVQAPSDNASIAAPQAPAAKGKSGGGAGAIAGLAALFADGGPVPTFAPPANYSASIAPMGMTGGISAPEDGPASRFGQFLAGVGSTQGGVVSIPGMQLSNQQPSSMGANKAVSGIGGAFKKLFAKPAATAKTPQSQQAGGPNFIDKGSQGAADQLSTQNQLDQAGAPVMAPGQVDAVVSGVDTSSPAPAAPSDEYAKGGKVDALVSPGEVWLTPKKAKLVAKGKNALSVGERIAGTPKVQGNSYANDTVPKKLEVGGIVIPNSIMQSGNPAQGAHDFVARIMAKRKNK
jgi:hypothetical protein